jgi:hypothetical protein
LPEYLSDENKNKPQLRYEAAVLLTKVAGGEHEALNQMLLDTDYSDAGQIPASAKPYVAYATKKKIMQGTGESKFEPLLQVSRAQMATMMFNTLRAINFTIVDATVQSTVSSNKSINVIQKDNVATKYTLSDNTLIRLDGKRADFDALIQGMSVRIYLQEGSVRMVEGVSTFETLVAEGKVIDTGTKQGGDYITIELEDEEGKAFNKTFSVAPNAVITLDGAKVYLSSLKNQYAKVYYNENETSYKIEAENRIKNAYGTLYELVIDPPSIIIKTSNDELQTYYLLDNVSVVRDGLSAVLRDLVVGDRLDLTLEYGKVKSIRATSISDSKEGIIKTLTFSDTNEITVKIGEETLTYNITPNTLIYVDDQPASMYDLRVGAKAKIYTESNNITKIYTSEVIGPSQITGVVKNINTNYYIITLEEIGTGSGEQKVAVKRNCVIVDNTGRNITTFSKIPKGSTIVCFGDMNSGIYEVNTIIITN